MSDQNVLVRKDAIEKEITDLLSKREFLIQSASTIQKQVSELDKMLHQADGKYIVVCEIAGLDPKEEGQKFKESLLKKTETESK